jgi:hypothetical protein
MVLPSTSSSMVSTAPLSPAPRVLDLLRGNDCASCAPNVHWLQSRAPWAARGREAGLASWTRLAQAVVSLGLQ